MTYMSLKLNSYIHTHICIFFNVAHIFFLYLLSTYVRYKEYKLSAASELSVFFELLKRASFDCIIMYEKYT